MIIRDLAPADRAQSAPLWAALIETARQLYDRIGEHRGFIQYRRR